MSYRQDGYQITRHVCPRNCYDACGMLAYVRNGRLEKVSGDPNHGYTAGKLCAKGYGYVRRVYSPNRLRYPMRQIGRGSGRWERLNWDQALDIISDKILYLKDQYGSTLPLCLNKYSGNFGILHYAVEGMFNSLGPTTQAIGSPCWSAGLDAQIYDMGLNANSDPADMENARLIILWGVNPAWTAVHSLPYIYRAREKGAKVIVIDPVYTATAKKADYYFQLKPGSDGALAIALAKVIAGQGRTDQEFIVNHTTGWQEYEKYLKDVRLDLLLARCGQNREAVQWLAGQISDRKPVFFWVGFGMQRHVNGGQNLRAINALGAMTGNIGVSGGGVHYAHQLTWRFNFNFLQSSGYNRYISINRFADELAELSDPPVKFLWVACRNLLTQDVNSNRLLKQLAQLDCIVTVEQFFTPTANYSDIVLPATSHFEEIDVVPGYWHHWISLNEQAIAPFFEARSDFEIAQMLARTLNRRRPGTSSFPTDKTAVEILDEEFSERLKHILGIKHWSELKNGPKRANIPAVAWEDKRFPTMSGKFEFFSGKAIQKNNPPLPEYKEGVRPDAQHPYWLITSHAQNTLNSQFQNQEGLDRSTGEPVLYIHPETAKMKNIQSGDKVRIYNLQGEVVLKAEVSSDTSPDVFICYQGWNSNNTILNALNAGLLSDMGEISTGVRGLAFYDVFVNIELA